MKFSLLLADQPQHLTPTAKLESDWTTFLSAMDEVQGSILSNADLSDSDDQGADFEDSDDISILDFERLIDSLNINIPTDNDTFGSTSSELEDDESLSSDEEVFPSESETSTDQKIQLPTSSGSGVQKTSQSPMSNEPDYIPRVSRHDSSLFPRSPRMLHVPTTTGKKSKRRIRRRKQQSKTDAVPRGYYEFNSRSQVVGVAYLEIVSAKDLPPLSNMTRTGFDMDPFVVVSFGKKTFRTPSRRHTLNPIFNDSLMFPVLTHEKGFSINFTVMDKDKITLNDHVATADFSIQKILETVPQPDKTTLLYNIDALGMQYYPAQRPSEAELSSTASTPARTESPSLEQETELDDSSDSPGYSDSPIGLSNTLGVNRNQLNTENISASSITNSPLLKPPGSSGSALSTASTSSLAITTAASDSNNLYSAPQTANSSISVNGIPPSSSGTTTSSSAVPARSRKLRRRKQKKPAHEDVNMVDYIIPLTLLKSKYEGKHKPELHIRARFIPYAALRQQFWRGLIRMFDTNQSQSMDIFEITELLDQIGATLSQRSVESFFKRFGKRIDSDELTIDEFVICLEEQILKDTMKKYHLEKNHDNDNDNDNADGDGDGDVDANSNANATTTAGSDQSASTTKSISISTATTTTTTTTPHTVAKTDRLKEKSNSSSNSTLPSLDSNRSSTADNTKLPVIVESSYVIDEDGFPTNKEERQVSLEEGNIQNLEDEKVDYGYIDVGEEEERLIRVLACPFCGQPRLNNKSEIDIVTHLATCASQDWARADLLSVNKFVSSNQARKRWYTKMMFKVTYGNYKLGANSANILVQDRETGFIQEEKMNAYVRMGIRLLYKGLRSSSMESKRIRKILRTSSFKQGRKYDDPSSTAAIMPFIKFHNLDLSEVLLPLDKFKTFNQFFYRKLKPGSRICDAPDNKKIAVSPADCRSTYFPTITKATEIWIKGRDFSVARLFGDAYPEYVDRFTNGSLAIFRLAPQDYHRFHIPVGGVLGEPRQIDGEYYTVNPMAIRSALDVYGENVRVLVPIQSEEFGLVMVVCVGAMMVGSTVITRKAGERVERMEELGYFQFGGSTLVVLFEPGKIKFDKDLVSNSSGALETLVKVGMSIGYSPSVSQFERHDPKPSGAPSSGAPLSGSPSLSSSGSSMF